MPCSSSVSGHASTLAAISVADCCCCALCGAAAAAACWKASCAHLAAICCGCRLAAGTGC
eukprot:2499074-Pyramimonas_sp.AAC.1